MPKTGTKKLAPAVAPEVIPEEVTVTAHACSNCEAKVPTARWEFLLKQRREGKIPTKMVCIACQSKSEDEKRQYGPPKGVVQVESAQHAAIAMADFVPRKK